MCFGIGQGGGLTWRIDLRQMRVQWAFYVDFLPALRTALDDFEVSRNGSPFLIIHGSGTLIADPGVRASTTRVDPHDVLETEIVSQRGVDDFDSHSDERPTLVTDVGFIAAGSDLVVICQIDIEN